MTTEDDIMRFFRNFQLPNGQFANPIKINSAYNIETYLAKQEEVTLLKNKVKNQALKEAERMKSILI